MKYQQSSTSSARTFAWPKLHLMWLLVFVTSPLFVVIDANSRLQRMPFYYGKRTLGYVHHLHRHHHHHQESEPPASDQGRQLISSSSRNEPNQQPHPFLTKGRQLISSSSRNEPDQQPRPFLTKGRQLISSSSRNEPNQQPHPFRTGRTSYSNTRFINGMGTPPTGALRDVKQVLYNEALAGGRVGPPPLMKPETRSIDSSIHHSSPLDASKEGGIQFDDDEEEVTVKRGSPEVRRELIKTNVADPQAITDDEPFKDRQMEDSRRLKSFLSLISAASVTSSPLIKRKELIGNSYFDDDEGRSIKVKNSGGGIGRGGGQDSDDKNNLFLNPLDMSYPLNHLFGTVMFNVLLFKHRANKGGDLRDLVRSRIEMERRNAGLRKSRFRSTLARMPQFYGKRGQR